MKKIIALFMLSVPVFIKAQVTQQQVEQGKAAKYHYILHNVSDVDSVKLYNTALSKINLDEYRLLNKRRVIRFDTGVTVELLSAKELKDKYGKPISPLNKKNANQVVFYLKPDEAIIITK